MDVAQLIQTQLTLECIGLDQNGLLVRIPGPCPDDIARVYVFRHEEGYALYFRHDVSISVRERINALGPATVLSDHETVRELLAEDSPCDEVFVGRTCLFPDTLRLSQFPDVIRLAEVHRPLIEEYHAGMNVTDWAVWAVIRDGMIVSTCCSSRENERAGEAYVYTVSSHRQRGYGRQTTAAWAYCLQQQGKIPFYSHAVDNLPSQAVAESLRLQSCYACVNYS